MYIEPRVNEERCPANEGGPHEPAYSSVTVADGVNSQTAERGICDIACKHCGRSGAFAVTADMVDW